MITDANGVHKTDLTIDKHCSRLVIRDFDTYYSPVEV